MPTHQVTTDKPTQADPRRALEFQAERTYPCAIADQSDEGHEAALEWLLGHLAPDQRLTVWVSQKGVLTANEFVRS